MIKDGDGPDNVPPRPGGMRQLRGRGGGFLLARQRDNNIGVTAGLQPSAALTPHYQRNSLFFFPSTRYYTCSSSSGPGIQCIATTTTAVLPKKILRRFAWRPTQSSLSIFSILQNFVQQQRRVIVVVVESREEYIYIYICMRVSYTHARTHTDTHNNNKPREAMNSVIIVNDVVLYDVCPR